MPNHQPSRGRLGFDGSTLEPAAGVRVGGEVAVPGLTVLAHPDPARVGERVALTAVVSGRRVALSRLEPEFAAPSGVAVARPLGDAQMSRSPAFLEPSGSSQGVRIVPAAGASAPLSIVGRGALAEAVEVGAEELAEGVVLHVARVVLLLHRFDPTPTVAASDHGMVGASDTLIELRRAIDKLAPLAVPVLVRGETGTGKELVARALHAASGRSGPLVCVNMASVPPSLAAAELFGVARGAYTGASRARCGYFASAGGGTLFLDEIGETPVDVQALLLRALDGGEIQPVGGGNVQRPDVRVVAATDAPLDGSPCFRAPLLHRLSGAVLSVPPLRRRRDDLGRLLVHFLRRELCACGGPQRLAAAAPRARAWLPAGFLARLAAGDWPGNVRQLRNVARHLAVHYRDSDALDERVLEQDTTFAELLGRRSAAEPGANRSSGNAPTPRRATRPRHRQPSQVADDELIAALRAHRWRLQPAARTLGISRTSLYALIDRCPALRRAGDLGAAEIRDALDEAAGDLAAVVDALQVSKHGILQRMRELGIQ
jgi:DNA-binding NtrC family response regulator